MKFTYKCGTCAEQLFKPPVVGTKDYASEKSVARTQGLGKFRCAQHPKAPVKREVK